MAAGVVACGGGGKEDSNSSQQQTAPAQTAAQVSPNLFIDLDTVRGSTGIAADQKAAKSCVQASKIPVGGQIVWRIKVLDPRTGKEMDDTSLASVTVTLSDGQTFTAKYGGHPSSAPVESFWATSWNIPATYPTGALDYTVVAKDKEGRTGEWHQLKVASAMLQIVATDPLAMTNSSDGDLVAAAR
jgi:hypothetical protein